MSRPVALTTGLFILLLWYTAATFAQCEDLTYPDDCPFPHDPTANCGCDWADDLESYDLGVLPRVNGWEEWRAADPQSPDLRALVTDEVPDHTTGNGKCLKVESDPSSDQVRRFHGAGILGDGVGYDVDISEYWILQAWVFVPNTHANDSYLLLHSVYEDGSGDLTTTWHVQFEFNSVDGKVWNSLFSEDPPPDAIDLVKGEWTPIRVEMNFEADVVLLFYDGSFLGGWQWAASLGHGPDTLFLGALQLVNGQGTAVYWDDFSLARPEWGPARPRLECKAVRRDENNCSTFLWQLINDNDDFWETIDEFYIDVEAGEGGRDPVCVGSATSTQAITPPPGWSVENCTNWKSGHALFRLTVDDPADALGPGESVTGSMTVDVNKSREFERPDSYDPWVHGTTVPPHTVLTSAAPLLGNEDFAVCAAYDFSFGPAQGGAQLWSTIQKCVSYLNAPATTDWARLLLLLVLSIAGMALLRHSRRDCSPGWHARP